jgi:tRNA-binding EMAP/Myf-like protein
LVVGAAPFYKPEELVGKVVVVCTNLEPKKIGGIVSNGMLLAAVY